MIHHGDMGLLSLIDVFNILAENTSMIYEDRELLNRLGGIGIKIYEEKHAFIEHAKWMKKELTGTAK